MDAVGIDANRQGAVGGLVEASGQPSGAGSRSPPIPTTKAASLTR
jgi:hypothetical protein